MAKNTVNQISVKDNLIPADKFNNLPVNHTEYVYDYAKGSKNWLSRINCFYPHPSKLIPIQDLT